MKAPWMILVLLLSVGGMEAVADGTTPLQISLWNPAQFFPDSWNVIGLRVNALYGRNAAVSGLDVGLLNRADEGTGVMLGGFNSITMPDTRSLDAFPGTPADAARGVFLHAAQSTSKHRGVMLAMLDNYADNLRGMQVALGYNMATDMVGIQIAAQGNASYDARGLMLSVLANRAWGDMKGAQVASIFNVCDGNMSGIQLGVINYAGSLRGVQIGLINVNRQGPVYFLPIINARF